METEPLAARDLLQVPAHSSPAGSLAALCHQELTVGAELRAAHRAQGNDLQHKLFASRSSNVLLGTCALETIHRWG